MEVFKINTIRQIKKLVETLPLQWRHLCPWSGCVKWEALRINFSPFRDHLHIEVHSRNTTVKRYTKKYQWHIEILNVKGRSGILFHPANNALNELNGCIAPVTKISGAGLGLMSRKACAALKTLVFKALAQNEKVVLIIQS